MKIPIKVKCNRELLLLFSICRMCKLSFSHFLFLYQKFGKDIFYFFYICSGKSIDFPPVEKIAKVDESVEKIYKYINGNEEIKLDKIVERRIFKDLTNYYFPSENELRVEIELKEDLPEKKKQEDKTNEKEEEKNSKNIRGISEFKT